MKNRLFTAIMCGLLSLTLLPGFIAEASAASAYPAPAFESAKLENGNYVLKWNMPSNVNGTPAGGYDIWIDGKDSQSTWRTTGTSQTISGLDASAEHTFMVEARWTQPNPSEFPLSTGLKVSPVAAYPAPMLSSAKLENGNYVLNWSLPANPTGTPAGGYDIFIDGIDTNATWRATGTSQTISGLDTKVAHTFKLEARWTQADPSEFPQSNELLVEAAAGDTIAPTVAITSPSANTAVTSAQTLTIVAGASDETGVTKVEFYKGGSLIGTDTTNTFSATLALGEADNGNFNITAVAYDAAGNSTTSSPVAVTVNIVPVEAYPAPVLSSAKLEGDKYILNWTLPANPTGTPEGGYDIFIDGTDTNATWRATGTSQTISGLDTKVAHTFKLESRWTQADPSEFPQSNQLTVEAAAGDTTAPTVAVTSPSANTTVTSAQTLNIVASASDDSGVTKVEFYDGDSLIGTDTSNTFSVSLPITEANNGTCNITAVAYDAAGNSTKSPAVAVTVNIAAPAPAEPCPAPVLNSAKLENGKYLLSWSLPANPTGTPAGGYDIWIDGIDTNATWRATGTSQTITGLSTSVKHTFMLEARWTQVDPSEFPRSDVLTVAADTTAPDDSTTPDDSTPPDISGPVKVFPGAEGYGTNAKGGRGGKIIRVTNLNDSGSGSLRAAIEASGPRIVVFEVAGAIHLKSMLKIRNPYVTVAGQTAPGQGIMLRDSGVSISTNDVLIQHLAIRPGDEGPGPFDTLDGVQILKPSYNVVIDHCSVSWAIDENADTWTDVRDVTFSNCIISEGLRESLHSDGKHSKGYLAGRRNKNIAFIGNLQAHNDTRNPMVYGNTTILLVNNVFYNAGAYSFSSIGDGWGDGPPTAVIVGNVYRSGPNTTASAAIKIESNAPSGTKVYEASNFFPGGKIRSGQTGYYVSSSPMSMSGITVKTSESEILKRVLNNAGARPAKRDAVDNRIANPSTGEVVTGKGNWVDSVNGSGKRASGGWPSYPLTYRNFDAGSNPNGDDNGNGYTNIEEILYQMALQVEK
jgi:hypothetical protein